MKTVYEVMLTLGGLRETQDGLATLERNVNLLNQASQAVGGALSQVGGQMLDFSDQASRASADMQRGLTNLTSIMGTTAKEGQAYNEALTGILERTNYQVSRNDALTSSYDAASAGYTDAADAAGLLESSMNLAIAGTSGLDQATNNLQDSQKAVIVGLKNFAPELAKYGDTTAQAEQVSKALYQTIKLGITDISQLAPQFAEIGPAAAAAGLSMNEVAGAFAVATSKGVKTSQVTTGMKAALDALARGGATTEAKEMLAELGVQFDLNAVSTKGFVGVLADLDKAGLTGYEQLIKLTGSSEAAGFLANLTADVGKTTEMFGSFETQLEDVAALAEGKGTDALGRMTEATNRFESELAMAGENLAPIKTIMTELATEVLEAFNALPESVQSAVGSFVVLGGAVGTTGGQLIQTAAGIATAYSSWMSWSAQVAQATKAGTAVTQAATVANTGFAASLAAAAAPATALVAVLGSLALAAKHYQNIASEKASIAASEDLVTTEQLTQKVVALGMEMKKTGQALPKEEFDQWLALLNQANGDGEALTGVITAFTNAQKKATQGAYQSAEAQYAQVRAQEKQNEAATKAQAVLANKAKAEKQAKEAAEAQAAAARKQEEANRALMDTLAKGLQESSDSFRAYSQALQNQMEAGTITVDASFKARSEAIKTHKELTRKAYQEILKAEVLSKDNRAKVSRELNQTLAKAQQDQLELRRQWAAQLREIDSRARQVELLALQEKADKENWTQEATTKAIKTLKAEQLRATIATIEAEVRATKAGSDAQSRAVLSLYQARAELAGLTRDIRDTDTQQAKAAQEAQAKAAKESAEAQAKAAQEATEARKKAWEQDTSNFLASLEVQGQAANLAGQRMQAALSLQASIGSLATGSLGDFEKAIQGQADAKAKVAEIQARIVELTKEEADTGESRSEQIAELRANLEQAKTTQGLLATEARNTAGFLKEMGVAVDANLQGDQAALMVAQARLALENEQIRLKAEQEAITIRLKQLEQDRLILELERKATSQDITQAERANLAAQVANAKATKSLLAEQAQAASRLADMQVRANTQGARVELASQGIDPKALGEAVAQANQPLKVAAEAQTQATQGLGSSVVEQTKQVVGSLGGVASAIPQAADPLRNGLNNLANLASQGTQAQLDALGSQTSRLSGELANLRQATEALPSRIAQAMPRTPSR